jgi:hypothetical protein
MRARIFREDFENCDASVVLPICPEDGLTVQDVLSLSTTDDLKIQGLSAFLEDSSKKAALAFVYRKSGYGKAVRLFERWMEA